MGSAHVAVLDEMGGGDDGDGLVEVRDVALHVADVKAADAVAMTGDERAGGAVSKPVCDNARQRELREGAAMGKGRFEAFSDGVLAIIITIMVLELKVPHGETLAALAELWPVFVSYVISFIYVGIYWNNHHHLLHATTVVTGGMMWANLNLLFWLSLLPFATGWMGENHFAPMPSAVYGVVLMLAALSWSILQTLIVREQGEGGVLKRALGADWKGKVSPVLYLGGIVSSFCVTGLAQAMYLIAALIWLVPDRRIEKALVQGKH